MNYLISFSCFSTFPFLSTVGPLEAGEAVVVKDRVGEDIGTVVSPTAEEEIGVILRKAEATDLARQAELKPLGERSAQTFRKIIKETNLPAKLVDTHIRLDKKKITFYVITHKGFSWEEAESRLAREIPLKVRIKEVSPRNYASLLYGIGKCGRNICCATLRERFPRVSIRTARLQNLFLPSDRISGICGRLLCCLAYEEELYQEALSLYPPPGSIVKTKYGRGEVVGIDVFHEKVLVRVLALPRAGGQRATPHAKRDASKATVPPDREVSVSLKEIRNE